MSVAAKLFECLLDRVGMAEMVIPRRAAEAAVGALEDAIALGAELAAEVEEAIAA